jgi:pimeloyl-ACP methyl ester carboxylesterase
VTDIHGAYQGGWIWKFVAERLRAKGHDVLTPTLEGCAERAHQLRAGISTETHGEEIAKLLYYYDLQNAVLVGTSSGGMVMACAAEQARDRVGRLVFADALALIDGESILDVVKRPITGVVTPLARGPTREDAMGRSRLQPPRETRAVLGSDVGCRRALLQPRTQSWRGAHPPRRRQAQGTLARNRHRPLPHAERAGCAGSDHPRAIAPTDVAPVRSRESAPSLRPVTPARESAP